MPRVSPGDVVLWMSGDGLESRPALVTDVFSDAVDLSLLVRGSGTLLARGPVRHKDDPSLATLNQQIVAEEGMWDFREVMSPDDMAASIRTLTSRVDDLEAKNASLEAKLKKG
jgi:hypothetical protein